MNVDELLPYWPALAALGLVLIAGIAFYRWRRKRPSATELERRRREMINRIGKMGDGVITEMHHSLITYCYQVRGIEYLATQDVGSMGLDFLPEEWGTIHAVSVKFDPRNPANSVIISEKWNGLPKSINLKTKVDQ